MVTQVCCYADEKNGLNIHQVPVTEMIKLQKMLGKKPHYTATDENPNESYSVLEMNVGKVVITFFSVHLVKSESNSKKEVKSKWQV